MARYVLDCSISMAWCFQDEANAFTDALYDRLANDEILVPDIWPVETINILTQAERRKRITPAQSDQFLNALQQGGIVIDHGCSRGHLRDVFALARHHGLSAYDAAYLELAMREKLPLATRDSALRKATGSAGIQLLG